jgi:hypothetical protein
MKADAVAKHYGVLTAEERFRLNLAAGARGSVSACTEPRGPRHR